MSPGSAADPGSPVTACVRRVCFLSMALAANYPQGRPVAWRPNDGVSIAWIAGRSGGPFLRERRLARFLNRDVGEPDEVVVVRINDRAGLDVVEAAALGRHVQVHARFDGVVAPRH